MICIRAKRRQGWGQDPNARVCGQVRCALIMPVSEPSDLALFDQSVFDQSVFDQSVFDQSVFDQSVTMM